MILVHNIIKLYLCVDTFFSCISFNICFKILEKAQSAVYFIKVYVRLLDHLDYYMYGAGNGFSPNVLPCNQYR